MPGRHQQPPSRSKLRWLGGAAGAAIVAATLLALAPSSAGASGDPVKATFSVTGVSTSNCPVSAGGSDVYVKPGQELDVKSSLAGLTLLGVPIDVSQLASLVGGLTIDPGTSNAQKIDISDSFQTVDALAKGNHEFKWSVTGIKVLGIVQQLSLSSNAAAAGADLTYTGTIHVTDDAAQCGVSVQVPGVQASASVTGLPPVKVSVPGVKVPTVPVSIPSLSGLPSLPGLGSGHSSAPASQGTSSSTGDGELPVPARVVPKGNGQAVYGNAGGGYLSGVLPNSGSALSQASNLPVSSNGTASAAAPIVQQDSTGKHKTIDLAASKASSTGQFSVILAIVAIIALSVVAATYARLYLLRRETPTA